MKSEHQQRVEELMAKAGQEVPKEPTLPSKEVRELRAKLILEEALETVRGLGFATFPVDDSHIEDGNYHLIECYKPNLEEIADGCWDTIVVTTGTLSACGIHDMEGQKEVDENNLQKFGPGGYRRDDGKWIKPPGHKKPDLKRVLQEQK